MGHGRASCVTNTGDPRLRFPLRHSASRPTAATSSRPSPARRRAAALLPIGRRDSCTPTCSTPTATFEGIFDSWRDRYAVSGTSTPGRTKRRLSIRAQQLRAAAALLAEWFRICLRQGYVGNHPKRNPKQPEPRNSGDERNKVRNYRQWHGLYMPMGPAAEALGLPAVHTGTGPEPSPT